MLGAATLVGVCIASVERSSLSRALPKFGEVQTIHTWPFPRLAATDHGMATILERLIGDPVIDCFDATSAESLESCPSVLARHPFAKAIFQCSSREKLMKVRMTMIPTKAPTLLKVGVTAMVRMMSAAMSI